MPRCPLCWKMAWNLLLTDNLCLFGIPPPSYHRRNIWLELQWCSWRTSPRHRRLPSFCWHFQWEFSSNINVHCAIILSIKINLQKNLIHNFLLYWKIHPFFRLNALELVGDCFLGWSNVLLLSLHVTFFGSWAINGHIFLHYWVCETWPCGEMVFGCCFEESCFYGTKQIMMEILDQLSLGCDGVGIIGNICFDDCWIGCICLGFCFGIGSFGV